MTRKRNLARENSPLVFWSHGAELLKQRKARAVTGTFAARNVRLLTAGLAVGAFVLIRPVSAKAAADPWTAETGVDRAKSVLGTCLAATNGTPSGSEPCVLAAFEACEREHGTSQHALNDCASFSKQAWEARLSVARALLMGARTVDIRFGTPDRLVALLAASERRWDDWNRADCDMQAKISEGGSLHRYELYICLSNHAAHRAIELETLVEVWRKIFRL